MIDIPIFSFDKQDKPDSSSTHQLHHSDAVVVIVAAVAAVAAHTVFADDPFPQLIAFDPPRPNREWSDFLGTPSSLTPSWWVGRDTTSDQSTTGSLSKFQRRRRDIAECPR
jgi:hypothetical protein